MSVQDSAKRALNIQTLLSSAVTWVGLFCVEMALNSCNPFVNVTSFMLAVHYFASLELEEYH